MDKVTLKTCTGKTRFCWEPTAVSDSNFSNFISTQRDKSCQTNTRTTVCLKKPATSNIT